MTPLELADKAGQRAADPIGAYGSRMAADALLAAMVPQLAAALKRACELLETYRACDAGLRPYLARNTMKFLAGDVPVLGESEGGEHAAV